MKRKLGIFLGFGIAAIAIYIFITTAVQALFYAPEKEASLPPSAAQEAPSYQISSSSYPSRLMIPSLNIDTGVQYVGITTEGDMATPNNYTDVGWYKYGPVPGQKGTAVIAGHASNGFNLYAVFSALKNLKAGDDIYIITNGGDKLHFVVSAVNIYPYDQVPGDILFNSQTDSADLNLVTCDGDWISGQKTYNERLVVSAGLKSF